MMKWIERFESGTNWAVLLMMAMVVLMLTVAFAIDIGRDAIVFMSGHVTSEQVFGIFSDLLPILIGIELMHTVKVYLHDHTVHIDVILTVALVALARKVVGADLKEYGGSTIIGLALLIAALAVSRWLVLRPPSNANG